MASKRDGVCRFFVFAAMFFVCGYFFLRGDSTLLLDDTQFHLIRLQGLVDSMRRGDWFPEIYAELYDGYGYALPLFYCNFFLYVPAALCLIGVPLLVSYNIFNLLLVAAMLFCSYYAAEKLTGSRISGLFFSMLYTGSAYFAFDLLKRGALGETQAFVVAPIILLGIYNSVFGDSRRNPALIVGFLLLSLSHLLSLLLFALFYLAFLVIFAGRLIKEPRRMLHILLSAAAVVLLGAGYLLPLAEQLLTTRFFSEWQASIYHPVWVAVSPANLFLTLTDQKNVISIGFTMLFVLILRLSCELRPKSDKDKFRDVCLLGGVACIFIASSWFPWLFFDPQFNIIQFPWRFFFPGTLLLSAAGAIMFGEKLHDKGVKKQWIAVAVCCALCCAQSLYVSVPEYSYQQAPPADDTHAGVIFPGDDFELVDENYLHINNDWDFWAQRPFVPVANYDDIALSSSREDTVTTLRFSGNTHGDAVVDLPLVYYLGYTAVTQDGERLPVRVSEHGVLELELGGLAAGTVTVDYTGTTIQHISGWLSLASAAVAAAYMLRRRKESAAAV